MTAVREGRQMTKGLEGGRRGLLEEDLFRWKPHGGAGQLSACSRQAEPETVRHYAGRQARW
jgi:hypothetical protein